MTMPDYAKAVKYALAADWAVSHTTWQPVLEVDDGYQPTVGAAVLLVADDGGPAVAQGAWTAKVSPRRTVLRMTAYAAGRDAALECVNAAADFVTAHKPGIARVEDVSVPLITKDRATGAWLASITVPVIVRKTA